MKVNCFDANKGYMRTLSARWGRQVVWDEIVVMTLARSLGPASCLGLQTARGFVRMDFETAANGSCPFDQRGSARTATSSAQVNIGMARGWAEASSAQVNTGMAREGASVRMAMSSAQGSIWPGGLLSVRQPVAPKCTLAWPGSGSSPYGNG